MPLLRMQALPGNLYTPGMGRKTHPATGVSVLRETHDNVGATDRGLMGQTPTIVALFDVLGFEERLRSDGLRKLEHAYDQLLRIVDRQHGAAILDCTVPVGDGMTAAAFGAVQVDQDYFSDTILLWTNYHFMALKWFCRVCNEAFCALLELGMPVRGAMSVGEACMDKGKRRYLGYPLVEAARVEKAQAWLGVSFGPSFAVAPFRSAFPSHAVLVFTRHRKPGCSQYIPGLVLDWPRHWRDSGRPALWPLVNRLNKNREHAYYYKNTLDFVAWSERNRNWTDKGRIST